MTARELNIKTAAALVSEALRDIELLADRLGIIDSDPAQQAQDARRCIGLAADLLSGALEQLRTSGRD